MNRALIIVDVQNDFLPGGALAVPEGDAVIPEIVALAQTGEYVLIVRTGDEHPEQTKHFDKWPVHCVAGTPGAQTDPAIVALTDHYFAKGQSHEDDGYSGFEGTAKVSGIRAPVILHKFLDASDIEAVDVVGLATDFCVKATALDAAGQGYATRVLIDGTRPVFPDKQDDTETELREAGVVIL